jgi:26S proteasome regulatory subunit N12
MADYEKAKALFDTLKAEFEKEPCDLEKCSAQLAQLKLLVLGNSAALAAPGAQPDAAKSQLLARETLELACFLSIRRRDVQGFERHVSTLKMYYNDNPNQVSEKRFVVQGLYLLHLLASDRIGEFHTELELISMEDAENLYIKQPIQLERYLMEGNYAKVLEAQKDVPQMYYSFFMERLLETVRLKVGATLERSYDHLPVEQAAQMLILAVAALQEFAIKENERKAREELDCPMGDMSAMTPSLTRRAATGLIKWEVKDGNLYFKKDQEKSLEIPALDLMVNTIGYATDLERIV